MDEAQESTKYIIEEEISATCDFKSVNGDMVSKAAEECVTLHQGSVAAAQKSCRDWIKQ